MQMDFSQPASCRDVPQRHLVHIFPGFGTGGSQTRFMQLVRGIPRHYRHTVLSLDGQTGMARHIPADRAVEVITPAVGKGSGLKNWMRCRSILRQLQPDLLLTYNWGAIDWCISNRLAPLCPHVHIEDGFGPEEKDRQLVRRVWTRRMVLTGSNSSLVVPSRRLERLALGVWKISHKIVKYIPNGIDCARFDCRRQEIAPRRPLVIGTVATFRAEKNLERLIRLFNRLEAQKSEEAELVIVGDGPERRKLEHAARCSRAANRIFFTGASVTPEKELARFDIFALTSDTEQMPLSILEAMAAGLPIVSFAVGDVPQMVAPENRAFASTALADEKGFLERLVQLTASPVLRRQLGDANRAWARANYDQKLMLESYLQLFG
jgi:glycosyltransferase involved in cell wall biosynthesis